MSPVSLCVVVSALCLGQTAFASIVNGGFEPAPGGPTYVALPGGSTLINGWTTTDTGVEWFIPSSFGYTNSPNGGFIVDLSNTTNVAGGIEQTFATVASTVYQVDFQFGTQRVAGRVGTAEIIVAAGGTSQTFSITNLGSDIVWESRSFTFTAVSSSTTLSFRNLQNALSHFAYIDGVSIVPSPGAVCVALIAGFGALHRRRD